MTKLILQFALYNEEVRTVRELYLGFSHKILCPQLQIICNFLPSNFLEGTRTTIKPYKMTLRQAIFELFII